MSHIDALNGVEFSVVELESEFGDCRVELTLKPLDSQHAGWIGYDLTVFLKSADKVVEFLKPRQTQLYLDARFEPEVPSFCQGLRSVSTHEIDRFVFEPTDEKDFRLELSSESDGLYLSIFIDSPNITDVNWTGHASTGVRIKVTRCGIEKFVSALEREHESLIESE